MMRCFLWITVLLMMPFCIWAQSNAKIPRVLFLLDGSSSMAENWQPGVPRFTQAGRFILALADSLKRANEQVEFGLRVFGHQHPAQERNCYDTKLEIKFSRENTEQMAARLEDLHGYGVSPIAFSLSEAAESDFENESKYAYSIVLVTDGGESCNGNICQVVQQLLNRKIFFRPYIVSLADYAELKDIYACLGTILSVTQEQQMRPAISTIVDAHREGFVRAKTGTIAEVLPKNVQPVKAPEVKPAVIPDTIKIPITIPAAPKVVETPKPVVVTPPAPKPTPPAPKPTPPAPKPTPPEPKKPQVRDRRVIRPIKFFNKLRTYMEIEPKLPPEALPLTVPPFVPISVIIDKPLPPAAPRRKQQLPTVGIRKTKTLVPRLALVPTPQRMTVPPFVKSSVVIEAPEPVKPTVTATAPTPKPTPVKPAPAKPSTPAAEPGYVAQRTPADDTYLEVYFTDGNGKFYATSPQIVLNDAATNKQVRQFFRTVSPDGNPDPVKVEPGDFALTVVGSDRTRLKAVSVLPNMRNKIIITVTGGSLQFVWRNSANRSKVDKYYAVVKRNFVPQPMVKQRCDTVMPYPPGNYHIEINTVPVSVRSVDLSFDATVIIPIDEPGNMQIINTENVGKTQVYYQQGDKFLFLQNVAVNGVPSAQNMELQPGLYEIHYTLSPGAAEKTLAFHIYSNKVTNIELK